LLKKIIIFCLYVGVSLFVPFYAVAQPPLNFGCANGIVDEFGNLLQGTAENPGDLVQIFKTQGNIGILPPGTDGTPDTNNIVIKQVFIGNGTDPEDGATGKFAGDVALDRSVVNYIFARMFNAPTLALSSFYTDSQIKVVNQTDYTVFIVAATQTATELDPADDDGEGLSNSWEKSLGTNPLIPDTDEDGVSDYLEFLAGTDALDINDFLQMVELIHSSGNDVTVEWSSVSGRVYQVEYSTNSLNDSLVEYLHPFEPVTAISDNTSLIFTNGALMNYPHFRVRLLP